MSHLKTNKLTGLASLLVYVTLLALLSLMIVSSFTDGNELASNTIELFED